MFQWPVVTRFTAYFFELVLENAALIRWILASLWARCQTSIVTNLGSLFFIFFCEQVDVRPAASWQSLAISGLLSAKFTSSDTPHSHAFLGAVSVLHIFTYSWIPEIFHLKVFGSASSHILLEWLHHTIFFRFNFDFYIMLNLYLTQSTLFITSDPPRLRSCTNMFCLS